MTTVLAIDQGTSGTKAVVVSDSGEVLGLTEIPLKPHYGAGGLVEQDPLALLKSVVNAGREAVKASRAIVDVVTLANQGETVLAWDPATGAPLSNLIVWQDRRAESVTRRMSDVAGLIEERTGLVLDPYFSAPKMTWLRENVTRDGVVTTSDTWLLYHLTGEFVTDVSTASRSLLTNLKTGNWDPELLALFGLENEELPRIVNSDEAVGMTGHFGGLMPVGGLIVDQQAALLAEKCLNIGEAKCTFGTGAFLLANAGSEPVLSKAKLSTSIAWRTSRELSYCLDGQVYTAASAVRWLTQMGFIDGAHEIDTKGAKSSDGLFSVPAFAGLAAPRWRPDAKASFVGATLSTEPSHFVTAVIEGIAVQVAELIDLVESDTNTRIKSLRVDGGLTQSKLLMQSVANLSQRPIEIYPSPHATPLGAAALARVAVENKGSLKDAVIKWKPTASFKPKWSFDQAATFRSEWSRIADLPLER